MSLQSLEARRRAYVKLEALQARQRVSFRQESLEACREVSVNLGSLEACKRASVSLVSQLEVSHYARFARALAVTTLRHRCGPVLVQFGTNLEQEICRGYF